jgi:hypothetical protein
MSISAGPTSPERHHLGRRLVLTLVILLAFATATGLVVGMLIKIVIVSLTGLI